MMCKNKLAKTIGIISVLFALTSPCALSAALLPPVPLTEEGIDFIEPAHVEALQDSNNLAYEEVTASPWRERFQSRADKGLNFGVTKNAVWLRFTLRNSTPLLDWILLVDNPRLEHVELFIRTQTGEVQRMLSGDAVASTVRPLPGREVAFPLTISTGAQMELYARIATAATLSTPLQMLTPRQYQRQTRTSAVMLSATIGAMLLLFIVAALGLRRYPGMRMGAYTAMVFVQLVYTLIQDGLATEYLWPDHPLWTWHVKAVFIFLLAPVALFYTTVTLDFRNYAPKLRLLALALVALGVVGAITSPWLSGQFVNRGASILSGATAALLLGAIPYVWLRGNTDARTFFLSGLPLILSAFAVLAHNYGLFGLPTSFVFHTYKLAYLLFLTLQLFHALGRQYQEARKMASEAQLVESWREVAAAPTVQAPVQTPAQAPDRPVLIHTLGRCEVWRDGNRVRFASRGVPRQQTMLALVLAGGTRGVSRTVILDTLWPDSDGDLAEKSFRTTLYRLRQAIGAEALQQSGSTLSFNAEVVWAENIAFEELAASLIQAIQSNPEPRTIEQAFNVLRLYGGDFLPGFDAPPITAQREHLRRLFHNLVVGVAECHISNDAYHTALDIYHRGLNHSEPGEPLFQGLLRCHLALGQCAEGLAAFERCRAFLHERFNAHPAAETERLKRTLADPQGQHIAAPVTR